MAVTPVEVLLIGGRSGAGKTTVAFEVSRLLAVAGVPHCLIDGDNLSHAHPAPAGDPQRTELTEANLTAVWRNFAARGYQRLIYVNTVSVLEADLVVRAVGGSARTTAVLLTARDETAEHRLRGREVAGGLDEHVRRSGPAASRLDIEAAPSVTRICTDDRTVSDIAGDVVAATGWR